MSQSKFTDSLITDAVKRVEAGSRLRLLESKGNLLLRKSAFFHDMSPFSIG
jgi:hypothetical protein